MALLHFCHRLWLATFNYRKKHKQKDNFRFDTLNEI